MADNSQQFMQQFSFKPQINISSSSITRMWLIFTCALLAVVQSAITDSGASFTIAFTAFVTAVLSELLMTSTTHGLVKLKDGSAAVTALVLALMLPNHIHPFYAVLGAAFAIVVVKHSFGGLGSNWLNPALGGWLFIRLSWPAAFSTTFDVTANFSQQASGAVDSAVRGFLNKTVFSVFGAELPSGYINLFSSTSDGIIADRAVLVLVFTVIIIGAFRISRVWFSFLYLGIFSLLVKMFGDFNDSLFWNGDVLYSLFTGGTLFAAFILIAEPSSQAKSTIGCIITAFLAAVFSFLFRYYGNSFYGCFYAIALINGITPIIRRIERHFLFLSCPPDISDKGGMP